MAQPRVMTDEVLVFRNLLVASGRDLSSFDVQVADDGLVRVTGPRTSATYAPANWITRFSRQLEQGYFDRRLDCGPIRVRTRG